MITVLDMSSAGSAIEPALKRSGLLARLRSLGPEVVPFGSAEGGRSTDAAREADMADLLARAAAAGAGWLVWIGADQLFLDTDVAARGLERLAGLEADLFTQWEHCRLPVGIGIRALAVGSLRAAGPLAGLEEFLERIRGRPAAFGVRYDDTPYVDLAASRLDARWRPGLPDAGPAGWSLAGFLAMAGADAGPSFRYEPPAGHGHCVDERGMPAPYGFETLACAEFPTYLMVDLTNRCNAACIHCPQSMGFDGGDGPPLFLNVEDCRRLVDEAARHRVDFVRFTADGEPLLHPGLYEILAYAAGRLPGAVGLTTNGSALNDRNVERLLDTGLYMIDVSLDAHDEAAFERIRVGLSYRKTVRNVERLIARRDARAAPTRIMVSFVEQPANRHQRAAFEAHWRDRADKVLIREMTSNVGITPTRGRADAAPDARWPCPHWFRRLVLNYDGMLKACPIDWRNESCFAELTETTLFEAWHGEYYRSNRLQHLNGLISPASLCHPCGDWRGTPWSMGYEKVIANLRRDPTESGRRTSG